MWSCWNCGFVWNLNEIVNEFCDVNLSFQCDLQKCEWGVVVPTMIWINFSFKTRDYDKTTWIWIDVVYNGFTWCEKSSKDSSEFVEFIVRMKERK